MDTNETTPETWLDALRDHPKWDEARREECFAELVAGFDAETLRRVVEERLADLSGADAEAVLRLLEMHGDEASFERLAKALIDQPDLRAERAWEALSVLAGTDCLDRYPDLAERWDELEAVLTDPISPEELAAQLDADPESVWLALEALNAIEPELRAAIVDDLRGQPANPGLVAFLHALVMSEDEGLRQSALGALEGLVGEDQSLEEAWRNLAERHPNDEVRERAGGRTEVLRAPNLPGNRARPEMLRTLVTAVDATGRGEVIVVSRLGEAWLAAAFSVDVEQGLTEVFGHQGGSPGEVDLFVEDLLDRFDRDAVECRKELALGLLAGSLSVSEGREERPLSWPYWLERTVGTDLQPGLFPIPALEADPSGMAPETVREAADRVLGACPGWVDRSELVEELARDTAARPEEIDPGAVRFLVERELLTRIETIRRMLLWMAAYWTASGEKELSRDCVLIAGHLGDDQHAVPGHPFLASLARRSLVIAAERVRAGESARPSARALETQTGEGG